MQCQTGSRPCRRPAVVAFVLQMGARTVGFARCAEHAPMLRTALRSLLRSEQWIEAPLGAAVHAQR